MSLSPSTCTLDETMVLSSNEQWVCQVFKGEEDKWRVGARGCEDNGFLWWLTFQSGVSKKVWLCYCVFTDSQMSGGLGTSVVCGSEGNKHTMSNLYLGCLGASEHLCVYHGVNWEWHSRPFLLLWKDPHLKNAASVRKERRLFSRFMSHPATWLTGHSTCQVGSPGFLSLCCDTPVTRS